MERAQAGVAQASAALDKAKAAARPADVAAAAAEVRRAQAQVDLLKAGRRPETLAVAEADVAAAQVGATRAESALRDLELRAPFAGVVATLAAAAGETVLAGQPVVTLADLSRFRVETTDLSERDVARVAVGQTATVYVEALGSEIAGKVARIAPRAGVVAGDVIYLVVIELDSQPQGLRWGMSATVDIAAP
jgi:multidrug resistance efflux pump